MFLIPCSFRPNRFWPGGTGRGSGAPVTNTIRKQKMKGNHAPVLKAGHRISLLGVGK